MTESNIEQRDMVNELEQRHYQNLHNLCVVIDQQADKIAVACGKDPNDLWKTDEDGRVWKILELDGTTGTRKTTCQLSIDVKIDNGESHPGINDQFKVLYFQSKFAGVGYLSTAEGYYNKNELRILGRPFTNKGKEVVIGEGSQPVHNEKWLDHLTGIVEKAVNRGIRGIKAGTVDAKLEKWV